MSNTLIIAAACVVTSVALCCITAAILWRAVVPRVLKTLHAAVTGLETATSAFQASAVLLTKGAVTSAQDVMSRAISEAFAADALVKQELTRNLREMLSVAEAARVSDSEARKEALSAMRSAVEQSAAQVIAQAEQAAQSAQAAQVAQAEHTAKMASQLAVAIEARDVAERAAAQAQKRVEEVEKLLNTALLEAAQAVSQAQHAAENARNAAIEADAHAQRVRALPKQFGPDKDAHPGFASKTGSPYDPVA